MTTSTRYPALFVGHGSPMIALADNALTDGFHAVAKSLIDAHGKPKAILMYSAHWVTPGTRTSYIDKPDQIYDMYGFPDELYAVKYEPQGSPALAQEVVSILGEDVVAFDRTWGIDHGTWTVLKHLFPEADIPVIQVSLNMSLGAQGLYEQGKALTRLRDEGILLIGSGNIVHNLGRLQYHLPEGGSPMAHAFAETVRDAVLARNDEKVIRYEEIEFSSYAAPTPEHFWPLLPILGATQGEKATVFNDAYQYGSLAMTSFNFER